MRRFRSRIKWLALGLLTSSQVALAAPPPFEVVKARQALSESRLWDRNGELIDEQRSNLSVRHIAWTELKEISPAVTETVIGSEDQRFFEHHGVDWLALTKAAARRLFHPSKRGASTISMQLAALIDRDLKPKHLRRDWRQKIDQIEAALELEETWTKPQILEAYLNLISFRGELQGIASAARGLFSKDPSGLDRTEALLLAALIRAPEAAPEAVITRACSLAEQLRMNDSCARVASIVHDHGLIPRPFPPTIALAPHVARLLPNDAHSSLDRRLQAKVLEILRAQVLALRERNMNDAAALVVDNRTGQVLAYVGSIGDLSRAHAVDGVRASRQAGSTLKPFLYDLAIEKKFLTAASKIDDSATDIGLGPGSVYRPRDFDHEFHGEDVTLRDALASSLNVPAVKTLELLGVGSLIERMGALGFSRLRSEEFYGPSLALGTADVTLWELVNAYRTLANQGRYSELTLTLDSKPSRRVLSPGAAFIIADILSDQGSRGLTFGLDSPMALRYWSAAKTGTSKDMRDNWCIGFTERYTVGVWAGNFSGAAMWNVTGVSGAAPAWAEIMDELHRPGLDHAPRPPQGVVRIAGEWYLSGTEPNAELVSGDSAPLAKITYPVDGMLIARDPDIPADRQRVFFEATVKDSRWMLNGQPLEQGGKSVPWAPGPAGAYELKLVSRVGDVLDRVHFTVR